MATIGASTLVHAGDVSTGATNPAARKILFLGNSITLHPPKADIGWTNNFGMAASAQEKDYVHLLLKRFAEATGGKAPAARIENVADFEREYAAYPIAAKFKESAAFKADTVIWKAVIWREVRSGFVVCFGRVEMPARACISTVVGRKNPMRTGRAVVCGNMLDILTIQATMCLDFLTR